MRFIFFILLTLIPLRSTTDKEHNDKYCNDNYCLAKRYISMNPSKGEVIWQSQETTEAIQWRNQLGLFTKTDVPIPPIEITLSPYTWHGDFRKVVSPLIEYNRSKLSREFHTVREFKFPGSNIEVSIWGQSIILSCHSPDDLKLFTTIERDAYSLGGRRVYVTLPENFKNEVPDEYSQVSNYTNFNTGNEELVFMNDLKDEPANSNSTLEFKKQIPLEDYVVGGDLILSKNFGLFIRSEKGVLGGLWGYVNEHAKYPYAYVDRFFVDSSIRGTGLGKELMNLFECYAKSRDISIFTLVTRDFQAPKFYEKLGYKVDSTMPKFLMGPDGTFYGSHHYYKIVQLNSNIKDQ